MKKLIGVLVCALLIRLALILVWYQTGNGDHISGDGTGYYALAKSVLAGKGFQWEGVATARRPPFYPIFIACFLRLIGPSLLSIYVGQALVGAFSCAALFGVGERLFDQRVGLVASALMAFDYVSVRQTVSVMTETLFVFFLIVSFYCLIRAEKERKTGWLIGAGLLSGASLLTRDVLILYYPCIVLWVFFLGESWRMRFYRLSVFVIPLLLVIGPWVLRNSLLYGRPVSITVGAASTFYFANNPHASGGTTGGEWRLGVDTSISDVQWPSTHTVSPEWERYIVKQSFDFIRNHPAEFVELMGKKIVNMWRPFQTDSPLLARWATALTYLPVITLGLWGAFCQFKRWKEFFPIFSLIAYTFLLHAVLIAHMRYRYPVMPFFMVFAAFPLVKLWASVRTRVTS